MLIIRAFFIYIAGYLGVTFLVIVSPLFIPMVLFKETKQYFDKWAKLLISFALQPVIMLVFIIFSLTAMDMAAFSGNYSIMYRIAGDASRSPTFDFNKYLTDNKIIIEKSAAVAQVKADNPYVNDIKKSFDEGGVLHGQMFADCTPENIKNDPEVKNRCEYRYSLSITKHVIDWQQMESVRKPAIAPPISLGSKRIMRFWPP